MRTLLVTLALGLGGCLGTLTHVNDLPESQQLERKIAVRGPGPLVHAKAGLSFAESYGPFQRMSAWRYDTAGLDMSVDYGDARPECPIAATFYVYPSPRMNFVGAPLSVVSATEGGWLRSHYAECKTAITTQNAVPLDWSVEGTTTTKASGQSLEGLSFTFRQQNVESQLRLFVWQHQWFLKYRFSYPRGCEAQVQPRLEELIAAQPWSS
jgi:hypothetical protein